MIKKKCGNCYYQEWGYCKYNPPIADMMKKARPVGVWLHIDSNNWCGKFKASKQAKKDYKYTKPRLKYIISHYWGYLWK